MSDYIKTPTIGEILSEEFLIPLGLSAYRVAKEINNLAASSEVCWF